MQNEYDFIIVGSGAGGGPLAARLTEGGHTVLLLEAGTEVKGPTYDVPAYHGSASQSTDTRWDFWVQHHRDKEQQKRDSKHSSFFKQKHAVGNCHSDDGVLYPRAAALGGCTSHHALITIYPHDSDWERIRQMTGDESWSPKNMRNYFKSFVENCNYRQQNESSSAGHGFGTTEKDPIKNWLSTELTGATLLSQDPQLLAILLSAIGRFVRQIKNTSASKFELLTLLRKAAVQLGSKNPDLAGMIDILDPNTEQGIASGKEGVFLVPLSTRNAIRNGTREVVNAARNRFPDKLTVVTSAFATQILFETTAPRPKAIGVKYVVGNHLFEADPKFDPYHAQIAESVIASARKEVIICAGTFNTPQLLMLSGIGPAEELKKHKIKTVIDLPGVGKNLHDRYEVTVINRMDDSFGIWKDAHLDPDKSDRWYEIWKSEKKGLYTTSGATVAFVSRSSPEILEPDLIIFGMPGYFKGYYPDYHQDVLTDGTGKRNPAVFTWAILKKSPTSQARGSVTLGSSSPFSRPKIEFNYFPDGENDKDAIALANAIRLVRSFGREPAAIHKSIVSEIQPGVDKVSDQQLTKWVRDEAWGHHACGTCRMGSNDDSESKTGRTPAVVDRHFRVRGVDGLRVVDASIFPDIPGFFIATPIYIVAEKAAEDILTSNRT